MDCADVRDAFARGKEPSGPDARRHAAECDACRTLLGPGSPLGPGLASLRGSGEALAPPDETAARSVRDALLAERGAVAWLRSRPTPARIAIGVTAIASVAAIAVSALARADLADYPIERMALVVAAHALLLGLLAAHALRGLHLPPAPRELRSLLVVCAIAVPLAVALLPEAHTSNPASLEGAGEDFAARALACFGFGSANAAAVVVVFRFLDRGEHRASSAAVLAAAAAGLAGALALQLHCAITHTAHLVAGHGTVALAVVPVYAGATRLISSSA